MYRIKPWKVGLHFSITEIKQLFKFGIPFQLNTLIAMAKDDLSDLMVAGIIGRTGFGFISWAQKAPRMPLGLMDTMMKISFPTLSRFQDHQDLLKKSIEKSIYFIAFIIFPMLTAVAFILPDVIHLFPKYSKLEPALIPMYLYCLNFMIAAVTTPITNAFNAVGKILTTTKMMIIWTILTWIFYPLLSLKFGYTGTAIAALIVGSSSFIVWHLAFKYFTINIPKVLQNPILSTILIAIVFSGINQLHIAYSLLIITKIISATIVFIIYNYLFSREEINWFIHQAKWLKAK